MKQTGLIRSADQVRAILDAATQFRVPIKPQPVIDPDSGYVFTGNHKKMYDIHDWKDAFLENCPYGKPGDRLYVRETWMSAPNAHIVPDDTFRYRATESSQFLEEWSGCWRSPAIMPKAAARIWLEVESVRVERVQDISEDDAVAEGVSRFTFSIAWEYIYGPGSWERNDWVFAVTHKVLSTTGRVDNQ